MTTPSVLFIAEENKLITDDNVDKNESLCRAVLDRQGLDLIDWHCLLSPAIEMELKNDVEQLLSEPV